MTRYRTIVADPPWPIAGLPVSRVPAGEVNDGRTVPVPYPTMSLDEIRAVPVKTLAQNDVAGNRPDKTVPRDGSVLYLWTTNEFLPEAFGVVAAWGFKYSQTLVWCKHPIGSMIGGTYRMSTEFCLFCRRGSPPAGRHRENQNWFVWPRSMTHSRKPDAFMDMVEQVSRGPYLELFARRQRLGWDTWGDEALEHVRMGA